MIHNKLCHTEHCLYGVKTEQFLISNTTITGTFLELPAWKLIGEEKKSDTGSRGHNQVLTQRNERVLWKLALNIQGE